MGRPKQFLLCFARRPGILLTQAVLRGEERRVLEFEYSGGHPSHIVFGARARGSRLIDAVSRVDAQWWKLVFDVRLARKGAE